MIMRKKLLHFLYRIRKKWRMTERTTKVCIYIAVICLTIGTLMGHALGNWKGESRTVKVWSAKLKNVQKEKQKQITELEKENQSLEKEVDSREQKLDVASLPWYLTLVNEDYPMKENYEPTLKKVQGDYQVDARIAKPLKKMIQDAEKEGLNIVVCSAYRSVKRQKQVFNESMQDRLNQGMNYWDAYQDTALSVALPGSSEHGLGLAVDLVSNQYTGLDDEQAKTKEAKWLKQNCHKYGFILRYPPEKTDETGIIYEPWHYRYVGVEDATKIMEQDVTLETYLMNYQQ